MISCLNATQVPISPNRVYQVSLDVPMMVKLVLLVKDLCTEFLNKLLAASVDHVSYQIQLVVLAATGNPAMHKIQIILYDMMMVLLLVIVLAVVFWLDNAGNGKNSDKNKCKVVFI